MSKYDPLWKHLKADSKPSIMLSFDQIKDILGFSIDHSFLNYKKEAKNNGYAVEKISLKKKKIIFLKTY